MTERLLRLGFISPATSFSDERCFSTLHRLITYFGSITTQVRMKSLLLCQTYKDELKKLSNSEIGRQLIHNDTQKTTFELF